MKKLLIIYFLILFIQACDPHCNTCQNQSPYACTSCFQSPPKNLFIKSCQAIESSSLFTGIAIVMLILYLIMLSLGQGVYRNVFQNIQLISLISWGYGSQNGTEKLTITNLGSFNNNKFLLSYGAQFFVALSIIGVFIILITSVDRLPHNTFATLIKRKRIIFPIRIQTLIFNMIMFSALGQACTIFNQKNVDILEYIVSIIAVIKQFAVLFVIFFIGNGTQFQIDDQNYYVFVQKLSTTRCYARNNLFLSLVVRATIITIFIASFDNPNTSGIAIVAVMVAFTLLSAVTLKYVKVRFRIFNIIGNILTCACLFCAYGCGSEQIGNSKWQKYKNVYYILVLILCSFFILINLIEIIANHNQILKQLRSIYFRFIICQKTDDAVQLNKYDSDLYRQKVTTFRTNLIYKKDIDQKIDKQQIQFSNL